MRAVGSRTSVTHRAHESLHKIKETTALNLRVKSIDASGHEVSDGSAWLGQSRRARDELEEERM